MQHNDANTDPFVDANTNDQNYINVSPVIIEVTTTDNDASSNDGTEGDHHPFKRTGSNTKLKSALGHSPIKVSLSYLIGIEVPSNPPYESAINLSNPLSEVLILLRKP